ncbi:MAG: tRNA uridine-5-carboxymethylaminomethyl(34) synthesis enzyme MnmG [Tenericutes bacterium]|nr:tRNA uridine-5-carboxymethylaminomethyl(34) synthesis enzyme MnmG [Mycoplasmatota bacterium]
MYEVIVIGGGHAGCEASLACARIGHKTLLITGNINNIADMPCNPSIGGSAKGIVVREIDALGGEMGINADKSHLQIKMLNSKKGPGVRSLRCQADKTTYPENMLKTLKSEKNLEIKEELVKELIVENEEIKGIITESNETIYSKKVIITTGTYLNADILRGHNKFKGGPHGEKPSLYLSESLQKNRIKMRRLKTGTPPRVLKSTIDYNECQVEQGDKELLSFSNFYKPVYNIDEQIPCYLTYTNLETHKLILDNLDKCALYSGLIVGIGPRYCPSVEDKIVKFRDKDRHQIFLEPERKNGNEIYVGGFSTTMPEELQEQLIHSMAGLHHAKITKYGYAIEYDAIDSTELKMSLESKKIKGLYSAGQINGTSGYEEAAAQGLIAGINASLSLEKKEPLILKRNEAYIGVLIDDLINKGITEPYRLLTSRAEYRLLLRHDNADIRLTEKGRQVGLINDEKYQIFANKLNQIKELKKHLEESKIEATPENNNYLESKSSAKIVGKTPALELLKRPELNIKDIEKLLNERYDSLISEQIEINTKYAGYIAKTEAEVEKMLNLEKKKIPENIDYSKVRNIATEARQKLEQVRPLTIGQATRISGVNPSDITMLLVYLKKEYPNE